MLTIWSSYLKESSKELDFSPSHLNECDPDSNGMKYRLILGISYIVKRKLIL